MEQKIDLEIRLRELAAQSMLEATNEIDVLEIEKSLLTSDQRMNFYAIQLEQQRKQLSNPSLSTDSGRGSKVGLPNTNRPISVKKKRADVIGCLSNNGGQQADNCGSSPSFNSLSNSQSPSKLSPVSGQSANSPTFTATTTTTTNSAESHHSRTGALRHSTNTLNSKQRARQKKREQLTQIITSLSNINCNMVVNNRANISISEIRIPLMWRDVDHFKGKGDYKRYAIFCLLKIDSQIYDTQLISDVDRDVTDVTFDDLIVFNEIDHNFELCLEVYSCVYLEQFSFSSTPRKLKEKLTNSVSKAMGRRLATQTASTDYTKELQAYDKSYRFAMIASAILKLKDASNEIKTYDLVLVSPSAHNRNATTTSSSANYYNNGASAINTSISNSKVAEKNTLPLFGHFCSKLIVVPDVFDKNIKTGFVRFVTINNNSTTTTTINDNSSNSMEQQNRLPESDNKSSTSNEKIKLAKESHLMDDNNTRSSANYSKQQQQRSSQNNQTSSTSIILTARTHYALLNNFKLHLWPVEQKRIDFALARGELPRIDNLHRPILSLNIDKYTRLTRVFNSSVTFEITGRGSFMLAPYCSDTRLTNNETDEMGSWLRAIEQSIYDSHLWGNVLNHYPPSSKFNSSNSTTLNNNNKLATNKGFTINHDTDSPEASLRMGYNPTEFSRDTNIKYYYDKSTRSIQDRDKFDANSSYAPWQRGSLIGEDSYVDFGRADA